MKSYYRNLRSSHLGIFAIVMLVGGVCLSARASQEPDPNDLLNTTIVWLQASLVVLSFFGASFLFNSMIAKVKLKKTVSRKLDYYLGACFAKYIILAVPCLFGPLMYYVTGNMILIMMTSILVLVFYLNRPTVDRIIGDMVLTPTELEVMQRASNR